MLSVSCGECENSTLKVPALFLLSLRESIELWRGWSIPWEMEELQRSEDAPWNSIDQPRLGRGVETCRNLFSMPMFKLFSTFGNYTYVCDDKSSEYMSTGFPWNVDTVGFFFLFWLIATEKQNIRIAFYRHTSASWLVSRLNSAH